MKQSFFQRHGVFVVPRASLTFVTVRAVQTLILVVLLSIAQAGGAAVSSTPAAVQGAPAVTVSAAGVEKLTLENGLLALTAKDADLRALLETVGSKLEATFHVDRAVQGRVSVSFEGKTLKEALELILGRIGSGNFLTGYDAGQRVKEVWILPKGTDAAVAEEDLRLRRWNEEDKKHFKEKYGSLERAVWEVFGKMYGKGRWDSNEWNPAYDRPPTLSGYWMLKDEVLASQESALEYALSFIRTYENMLQTRVQDLKLFPEKTQHYSQGYRFVFDQDVDNVPVEGGLVGITIARESCSLSNFTYPNIQVSTVPAFTTEDATAKAVALHESRFWEWKKYAYGADRYENAKDELKKPMGPVKLVVLPVGSPVDGNSKNIKYTYHLAYKVPFRFRNYFIDAQTGAFVSVTSNVEHLTATVSGMVYTDNSESNPQERGLANLDIRLNGAAVTGHTLGGGQYEYNSTSDTVSLGLESSYPAGRNFVILDKDNQPLNISHLGDYPFGEDAQGGFRPNVYYWTDRAFSWFSEHLGTIINVSPSAQTRISTFKPLSKDLGPGKCLLGNTDSNLNIEFGDNSNDCQVGSLYTDVILHEMTHAAVRAKRGGPIYAGVDSDANGGVTEGVASHYACRITGDGYFFMGSASQDNFYIDPQGTEAKPEHNNIIPGVLDNNDWQHYRNGNVVASTIWDLTNNALTDSKIVWDSLIADRLTGYTPEALYDAIFGSAKDPPYGKDPNQVGSHLWNTFSAHAMNLWARPNGDGGVLIDWFRHRSPNYQGYYVYRSLTESFDENSVPVMEGGDPKLFPTGTTSWADLSSNDSSKTYYFAVRAVTSNGSKSTFSNVASSKGAPYGGSPPGPPQSFTGTVTTRDGVPAVELNWSPSTSPNIVQYVIQCARNADFTIEKFERPVSATASQGYDKGGLFEGWPFLEDTM